DIIWTFNTLREKGHPRYRSYYGDVTKLEKAGERGVRFTLKSADNRELPQIIGQMPVLSKAYWSNRDFTKTTLEPPLGSGAYKIDSFDPGRSVTYRRVADYWGEDLPVNKGRHNVDVLRYDYYRDGLREALKLLKEAGWSFKNEKLVNDKTGQPLEFEILLSDPQMERIVLPFAKNLERMGVTARVRTVDNAQYEKRMETFDYDMAVEVFGQSLSPGNEQRDYWGSKAAEEEGSRNLLGIKSPLIDELIEDLIKSPDR